MKPDTSNYKLPSPSPEGLQIMEMLSEVNVDLSILCDVISRDPVLAATIMKYANSPLYRRLVEIKSVRTAVNLLGTRNVATAILVATMRGFGSPPTPASDSIWEHSMGVMSLARIIARIVDRELIDRAEFLATIHDIGAMTLAVNNADYSDWFQQALNDKSCLLDIEQQQLGFNHSDITASALSQMRLPDEIVKQVDHFHNRETLTELRNDDDKIMAILSLAHQLEAQVHGDTRVYESMPESIETLTALLGLSQDDIDDVIDDFEEVLTNGF